MLDAVMGKAGRGGHGVGRMRRRDQHGLPANLHLQPGLAGIQRAGRIDVARHLRAEHRLEEIRRRLRIGTAQMDMVEPVVPHVYLPFTGGIF